MNRFTKIAFGKINTAIADYQKSVKDALEVYRNTEQEDKEAVKQFKDEAGMYAVRHSVNIANARNKIKWAEDAMTNVIKTQVEDLRKEYANSLTTRPGAAFLDALRIYNDFNIPPTKSEIEALFSLNGGCPLGFRALSAVMKKTHCGYSLDYSESADFEKDLEFLDGLSKGNIAFSPEGLHVELVDILKNQPRLQMAADGSFYDSGYKWDSISILISTESLKNAADNINSMAKRWNNTVIPSIRALKTYEDKTDDETGETRTAKEQFIADFKETANAAKIKENHEPAAPYMRKESEKNYAEIVGGYKL